MDFAYFNGEYGRLYKEEDSLYHRLARHFGLSDSAFWTLYTLVSAQRPLTQSEVCGYLALSKQTVHSALKQLEQEGHIRLAGGPGRRKYLQLTPQGQALARRAIRPVLAMEERAFHGLSPQEQDSLLTLSRRHLDLMRQESEAILNRSQEE